MDYKLIAERQPNTTLLEQILLNRGIAKENISHFLMANEEDVLDPRLIANITEGAKMLIKNISQNNRTLIIVDSDCDGYTSSAILLNYLNRLFPAWVQNQVDYFIHSGKQHGLGDVDISSLLADNFKFVICPDSASNDYQQHKALKERGIDVLVIDHHEAEYVSPDAVIINNQLCNYPTKSLCGAAMVYKFCCYIDSLMQTDYAIEFEDLASLGLIADMMDGRDFETHFLIQDGLKRIRNPFFVEMMNRQKFQFQNDITPIGIAFYVVPYINAMTRSGTMMEKVLMFEAMLEWLSDEMIPSTKKGFKGTYETRHEQAGRTCVNVKSRQKRAQDASLENIEQIIFDNDLLENKILIIPTEQEDVDKNLAGLIANQLASKYARPVLVLRRIENVEEQLDAKGKVQEEKYYTYEGSGRNYGKSRLENFRQFCNDTGLVLYAEGHASAFGIGIREVDLQKFIDKTNELLKDFDTSPCYYVDLELDGNMLNDIDIYGIASHNDIWGQGLEEPLIAIKNIKLDVDSIAFIGNNGKTMRINISGKRANLIKFNIKDSEKEQLDPNGGQLYITVIGKCELNHYMGNETPQILVEDFEIVRRSKWDF